MYLLLQTLRSSFQSRIEFTPEAVCAAVRTHGLKVTDK
jgi:hypothetical protein